MESAKAPGAQHQTGARAEGAVTLLACPIGLFWCGETLALKTEYGDNRGRIDAYIVETGEFFWGDQPQTVESQREQLVVPVPYEAVASALRVYADPPWRRDDQATLDVLTLIDVAVPRAPTAAAQVGTIMEPHHRPGQPVLTAEALATWTDEEVRAAELYAGACYAVAGDNEVPVPEIPAKLAPYLPFSPFNLTGYGAPLVLVSGGDEAPWVGPFTDLAAINADGIAADELTAIARTILCDEIYQGGGSAAGEWTVQAVRVG